MKSLLHEQGRGLDIGKKISKGLTDGVDLIVQKKNVFPFYLLRWEREITEKYN